ncbi:hypothetical protein MFLO_10828 [Listeria floridensis FSL S10-1187]|uniref:DUF2975 domain-containing protein n=1 Tax=Listeria floridensis FSL S10-1187 TaxID=1265817 RepID=A0ABN0RE36_9LIST|nr:DUF2975 domain-containing protein [Listeria floridensis]EUJ30311.1 hypothetical protein MFLO_10828 [Listeria floridensis FSL S10-1187]
MKKIRIQQISFMLSVLCKLVAVGSLIIALISIIAKFSGADLTKNMLEDESGFFFTFQKTVESSFNLSVRESWIFMIVMLVSASLLTFLFWTFGRILQDLSKRFKPFEEKQVTRLRKISWVLLVYAIIPQLLFSILYTLFMPGYYVRIGVGATFFFALLFFCLTEVFRYGAELQKAKDEA